MNKNNKFKKNTIYKDLVNTVLPHSNNDMPVISIFSGILGMEIGLERAGFKTKLALDFDKHCKLMVEENRDFFGDLPYICEDISKVTAEQILQESGLKPGEIAILAGGPPCQPFSKSGLRKGVEDDRGLLFKHYLVYLDKLKPKAFILENVRGLYSSRQGSDFELIIKHFEESGYTIYWKILDAANHGVPQFRQRLFIIGFRDRIRFNFPEETHAELSQTDGLLFENTSPFVTVNEAIDDIQNKFQGPKYAGKYSYLLPDIPEGMNYSFYTAKRGYPNPLFEWRSKFWYFLLKIDRSKPSLTIQAYPGNNTGPFHWENRRLAIEEIRRLQSFPDSLQFNASYFVAHRLIGNAVPPLLSQAIGESIMQALTVNESISYEEYLKIKMNHNSSNAIVKSGRGSGKGRASVNQLREVFATPA